MTTFAIFYNMEDLAAIAGTLSNPGLTAAERTEVNKFWNGGLKDWAASPSGISPCDDPNDPTNSSQRIVISVNNRSLADFRALLRTLAAKYGATFAWLSGLANDMDGCSGAVEPWPPI